MKFLEIVSDHKKRLVQIGRSVKDLKDANLTATVLDTSVEKVLNYLNSGKVVFAFLHYVYNGKMNR